MTWTAVRGRSKSGEAFCPHCFLLLERAVESPWPPEPMRCPHCRLLIGSGRSRPRGALRPGTWGSSTGLFTDRRTREGAVQTSSPESVRRAIRAVARDLGYPPERLLMVDYQQRAAGDASLPPLDDVFAVFGSWKRARREAAAA